jgi:hypothetical protein
MSDCLSEEGRVQLDVKSVSTATRSRSGVWAQVKLTHLPGLVKGSLVAKGDKRGFLRVFRHLRQKEYGVREAKLAPTRVTLLLFLPLGPRVRQSASASSLKSKGRLL